MLQNHRVLFLLFTQTECVNVSIADLRIYTQEPEITGVQRQHSYGGFTTQEISPIARANSSTCTPAAEQPESKPTPMTQRILTPLENITTIAKADDAGHAWSISVPLPGLLNPDPIWGDQDPIFDLATARFKLLLTSATSGENSEVRVDAEFDCSSPCSCVILCAAVKVKCAGAQVFEAFLQCLRTSHNIFHVQVRCCILYFNITKLAIRISVLCTRASGYKG
jgi:hypothetical protein